MDTTETWSGSESVFPGLVERSTEEGAIARWIFHKPSSLLLDHSCGRVRGSNFAFVFSFEEDRKGGWSQGFGLKIFFSYALGGGGRYFSIPSSFFCGLNAVAWPGYTRDKLRRNFLELFLPSEHS